mmetsp:Transcript_20319/g.30033  ORF Transcript_20319/g.30033 Transcript_20319/m.30033 type:complete len:560 (+) Transcript_20319:66-1745(+)
MQEEELMRFGCIFKKCTGLAILTNHHLLWNPNAPESLPKQSKLEYMWTDFKDHMISPSSSPKAMLKLNFKQKTMPPLIFEILKTDTKLASEVLSMARSTISNLLKVNKVKHMQPPLKRARIDFKNDAALSQEKIQKRASLLASDEQLRTQYKDIVESGILDEEEFWFGRRGMFESQEASQKALKQGPKSALGADIKPVIEGTKKLFKLTPRDIHQIFLIYPAVEKAHKAKVPNELSENEFWVKYFQSQFYTKDRGMGEKSGGSTISAGDDMFSRYAAEYEEEKKNAAKSVLKGEAAPKNSIGLLSGAEGIDPTVNLTSQWADHHLREVDDCPMEDRTSAIDAQAVINRLNRHSMLVMKTKASLAPLPRDDPINATDLPELHFAKPVPVFPLKVENMPLYNDNPISENDDSSWKELKISKSSFCTAKMDLKNAIPSSSVASEALKSCTSSLGSGNSSMSWKNYPKEFVTLMHRHFQVISELLKHFYSAVKALKDLQISAARTNNMDKIIRIVGKMEQKYEELKDLRKGLPRDAVGSQLSTLIKPLLDSLDHAFETYEQIK